MTILMFNDDKKIHCGQLGTRSVRWKICEAVRVCKVCRTVSVRCHFTGTWRRHKMETFPRYWSLVRGIHRLPLDSPHKSQWRWASMFSLICARTNGWANTRDASDLRRHRAHDDVIVMEIVMYWYTHFWNCTRTNDCVPAVLTDINKFWCDIIMWTPRFLSICTRLGVAELLIKKIIIYLWNCVV